MPNLGPSVLASELAAIGRRFYERGWVYGTSGNFSAVARRDPLRLVITPSAAHKGKLDATQMLEVDASAEPLSPGARPSAEALLHCEIVNRRGAGAVLHTHSSWGTILSARVDGVTIEGYEMLKGLEGVTTHEHREWIPIIDNAQDMRALSRTVGDVLDANPHSHAFLLRRHGLYTWGATLADAERHVEILEFLFEVVGRTQEVSHGTAEST